MIVDFTNDSKLVYFNGFLPTYSAYRMRLVSIFSNEALLNGSVNAIDLTLSASTPNWHSFSYTSALSNNLKNDEIEGYYDCILEGLSGATWNTLQMVLCKVKNNFNSVNPDISYTSDNENNEQFIYFNND